MRYLRMRLPDCLVPGARDEDCCAATQADDRLTELQQVIIMSIGDLIDRQSIERIYPREVWEADAGLNSQGRDASQRGVLIALSSGKDGLVHIRRAVRYVGEGMMEANGVFLCPYLGRAYDIFVAAAGIHGAVVEKHDALEDVSSEYTGFIDGVLATARWLRRAALAKPESLPRG
jgi:hypothetical protein